jgi:hypothetical protein
MTIMIITQAEGYDVIAELKPYRVRWHNMTTGDHGTLTIFAESAEDAEARAVWGLQFDYRRERELAHLPIRSQAYTVEVCEI